MNCRRNKNARTTGHFFESWNGKRNLVRFDHSNEKLLIHSDVSPSSRCYWRMLILDDLDVCSYSTVRQRLFNHPRRLPAIYLFFLWSPGVLCWGWHACVERYRSPVLLTTVKRNSSFLTGQERIRPNAALLREWSLQTAPTASRILLWHPKYFIV